MFLSNSLLFAQGRDANIVNTAEPVRFNNLNTMPTVSNNFE
jgi:hypothetical protein